MSNQVKRFKIGLSAADKLAMKNEITQSVIATLTGGGSHTGIMPTYDDSCGGVRFYNAATTGEGIGLLEGATFMDWAGGLGNVLDKMGLTLSDIVERKELNVYDKSTGEQLFYADGVTPITTFVARFKKMAIKTVAGIDGEGNEYNDIVLRVNPSTELGFEYHNAFMKDDGTYADYFDISIYPLTKVNTSSGTKVCVSIPNAIPVMEVNPSTAIVPFRARNERGLGFEWNYIELLATVMFGTSSIGRGSDTADGITGCFLGNAKDNKGTKIAAWGGNTSSASNSLFLPNSRAALIEVGENYPVFTNDNYDADPVRVLHITAKEVGETYTELTFDGAAIALLNLYIHYNFHCVTGKTDTILTCNGYRSDYPVGYQPFKLFYIENFFGMYGQWCDEVYCAANLLYKYNALTCSSNIAATPSGWENTGLGGKTGWIKKVGQIGTRMNNAYQHRYNVHYSIETGTSASGFIGRFYTNTGTGPFAMIYGRYAGVQEVGGIHDFSCGGGGGNWTVLANSSTSGGCWGRVYRSVTK